MKFYNDFRIQKREPEGGDDSLQARGLLLLTRHLPQGSCFTFYGLLLWGFRVQDLGFVVYDLS